MGPVERRERELRAKLAELYRIHRERCQPIIDELAQIEARKPPRPIMFLLDRKEGY